MRSCRKGGVAGRDIATPGLFGEAGDLAAVLARQVEADDMRRETDAGLGEFRSQRAGVGLTGLDPVGDQDDGRLLLRVAQCDGCLPDGLCQRRLAEEAQSCGRISDRSSVVPPRRHDQFDVGAIAFLAMAIGKQADLPLRGHAAQDGLQRLAGDLELGFAVDAAPHRARGVEHDQRLLGPPRSAERQQQAEGHHPDPHHVLRVAPVASRGGCQPLHYR